MPGLYNGYQLNLIDSISISESPEFSESGKLKKYLFNVSVKGKILASVSSTLTEKHTYLSNQSQALSAAFSQAATDTKKPFEVFGRNGFQGFKCFPRIKGLTINEGIWSDYVEYNIEMEADIFHFAGNIVGSEVTSDIDETWSIEINDEDKRFTKVKHTISAKGKETESSLGWVKAKEQVDKRVASILPSDISAAVGKTLINPHNKKTSYRTNVSTGESSCDIEISYHSPIGNPTNAYATHDQNKGEKYGSESFRKFITIDGTINGLAPIGGSNRYSSANALWGAVQNQIESEFAAKTILSSSISHDVPKGIINYSYEIEDYPKPSEGYKSKKVFISQMGPLANPPELYVIHQTIAGGGGPIFQKIDSKKVKTKTVTIEAIGKNIGNLDTLQYKPANSIIESDSIQDTPSTGKKTRTTTFIWV